MRLRGVCTLVALFSLLWTSGCCWDHCCCRRPFHHHEYGCGCGCESSCYTPSCGCNAEPPILTAAPVPTGPAIPMPTPLMPGGSH